MSVSRRALLKSVALGPGAAVLAPLVAQLDAHAAGAKELPRRFVFVLQSNGFQSYGATPKGVTYDRNRKKLLDAPLTDHELPEDLSPLADLRAQTTIVQGLHGVHVGPYHGGGFGALGGAPKGPNHTATSATTDAVLAKARPAVFPIVGLGLDAMHATTQSVHVCSAWGENQTIPTQCSPAVAYKQLFGSATGAEGDFAARGNLLDFLKDDIAALRKEVAGAERDKLDAHVGALETMAGRQQQLLAMKDTLRANAPKLDKKYTTSNECQRLEAQFELTAAALAAGLTNVVTICSCLCSPNGYFTGLGITDNLHAIGHGGGEKNVRIRKFHIGLVAELAKKLAAIPEGGGTMLDRTAIVYTSDFADAHHSNGKNWPFVLVGGGALKLRTGRYLEYPGYGHTGYRSINALYCALLHAAGAPKDHFNLDGGQRELDAHGPLPGLLA
jgi:hypothetical protein